MLSRPLAWAALLLTALPNLVQSATAEAPIYGGLGVTLSQILPGEQIGAEVTNPPGSQLPDNRPIDLPVIEPGGLHPWHHLIEPQLPRFFRDKPSEAYVMLNSNREVMRVLAHVDNPDCGADFDWLKRTISKKYAVGSDAEYQNATGERALRIEFSNRQIDISCGRRLTIDYLDVTMIGVWAETQARRYAMYEREIAKLDKRKLVLERRKQVRFANTFTLGDQYRLEGAFGIRFERPFARNSTQKFPVDVPFYAVLPGMPDPFTSGDVELTISPEKHPIVIRGRFHNVEFDTVAAALRAKYGLPMKSTSRHIIHKVNGDHVILKRLDDVVELAFIDNSEQVAQRERLWEKESEGL